MNPTTPMTGAELQTLREACGLTRERLGELCGVAARTVKHWETRAGATVPADVAGLVLPMAQWVRESAKKGLDQARQTAAAPSGSAAVAIQVFLTAIGTQAIGDRASVVLVRYHKTDDMPQADRLAGLLNEVHGAMISRLVLDLIGDGFAPRVIWFDPAAYAAWATLQGHRLDQDTPAARAAWAAEAINAAIPHAGDQPPPSYTPAR